MAEFSKQETDGAFAKKLDVGHEENVAVVVDHEMTPWACIRQNPKVVLWSLYCNIGLCLIGYENLILSVCLAMPAFQMQFAREVNGTLVIAAYWQSAWNAMYNAMNIFGSITAGIVQDRFGRRSVILVAAIIAAIGIAVAYIAEDSAQFLASKVFTGFSMGMIVTVTQTYVSEISPLPMRGIMLSLCTIMMNLGFLIAISSTYSRINIPDASAFRVLFAAAWVFPAALLAGLFFLPESPYWLVMRNRRDDALRSLKRLSGSHEDLHARLEQMEGVIEMERRFSAESSFMECLRGTNLRRTAIILLCMYLPQTIGATLSSNAPYFLNQTGLATDTIIMLTEIGVCMGVVSGLVNILLLGKFGRRPLMFFGVSVSCTMYLIMGIGGVVPKTNASLMAIGVALQFVSLSYGPAVGSSIAVAGEVSASRLRAKSLGIGNAFAGVVGTVWTFILPYMFNSDEGNLGGNIGWVFLAMGIIVLILMFFFIPETKGRSFEELDQLFEKRLPARAFRDHDLSSETEAV